MSARKTILITGASRGIGRAAALLAGRRGWSVGVNYVSDEAGAEAVVKEIIDAGGEAIANGASVADDAGVQHLIQQTMDKWGRVDILVANAGILRAHDITEFPPDEWRAVIDINLTGYFLCAQAAARAMVPRKSGAIIQINSKSGKKGSFRNSASGIGSHVSWWRAKRRNSSGCTSQCS